MTLIVARKSHECIRDITIQDSAGTTITPGVNDIVRAIIGREGETAKLTVTSSAATANGSTFTKGAANRLRLDAQDLTFDAGVYSLAIDYYDNASAEWKFVAHQVFSLQEA